MKTLLYPAFDHLQIAEQPVPAVARHEVLLRVAACGICGSELEAFKNHSPRRTPPLVMGHEFCGTIEQLGEAVSGYTVGQQVVSNSLVPCGECHRCRRGDTHLCGQRQIFGMQRVGAFAEYVNVPADCLLRWPETLPARAACLAEPLANGVHIFHLTEHLAPATVLVLGAGPIGLMCQQAFQALGQAEVMVADLIPERLAAAKQLGAKQTFNSRDGNLVRSVQELTNGEGVDLVVDAVGAVVTKQQSVQATRPGGAVVWIGLHDNQMELNSYEVTLPERQIFGTYACKLNELQEALDLMDAGRVDATSWTHTFALDEGVDAFMRMLRPSGGDIKAVLMP